MDWEFTALIIAIGVLIVLVLLALWNMIKELFRWRKVKETSQIICKHVWEERKVESTTFYIRDSNLIPVQCSKCKVSGFLHSSCGKWIFFYDKNEVKLK